MTFPSPVDVTTSVDAADATDHILTLPGSIAAGQRILAFIGNTTDTGFTWPAGWTEFYDTGLVGAHQSGAYRDCDGTEGASITVTGGTSCKTGMAAFRIAAGSFASGTAPEVINTTGSSANPNSGNLTPSWGAADTLWLSVCNGSTSPPLSISSYPTNYGSNQSFIAASGGSANGWLALAARQLNAASEDPAQYTLSIADIWVAATIAIRPQLVTIGTLSASLPSGSITMSATGTVGPAADRTTRAMTRGPGGPKFREIRSPVGGKRR